MLAIFFLYRRVVPNLEPITSEAMAQMPTPAHVSYGIFITIGSSVSAACYARANTETKIPVM